MEKRKILLPVAILALLISGCTVKKRSQTESNSQGSSTPKTSESSSSGGSQGGGSQGGTSESQGGTSQESTPTSEESQGGTSQESVPTGSGYFVKLGEGQPLEFVTEVDLDAGVENELKNYKLQVNGVTAGEAIEFSTSAGVIDHDIGPNKTCNADRTGSEEDGWSFTIHNSVEGNVDIYFKLYDYEDAVMRDPNNPQVRSYSFWISGREGGSVDPDPTEPEQYALIIKGENQSKAKLVTNSGNENEWTNEQPLVLAENDQLAFCLGGDDWRKFDQLKDETPDLTTNFERVNAEGDPSDGNIKVKAAGAGTYNVYIAKANEGKTIYLAKTNTPEPPEPAAVYSYKLGEADAVEMEEVATPDTGYSKQYKKDGVALTKGTVLQILADDEPLEFTKDTEDAVNKCNLYKDGNAWKVHNDVASASIILKLDGANHWRIWVTGYVADPEAQIAVTFNITKDAGEGRAMYVAGDFTAWEKGAVKMAEGEGHAWTLAGKIEAGTYTYKFVIGPAEGELIPWKSESEPGNLEWEAGADRKLVVADEPVIVNAIWGNTSGGGEDPISAEDWYLVGSFNMSGVNWVLGDENFKLELHEDKKEEADQYVIKNVSLHKDDEFKFLKGDDWANDHIPTDDSNYKIAADGVYDIYFVPSKEITEWVDYGGHYYPAKTGELAPVEKIYSVVGKMGSENFDTDHDMTLNEGRAVLENLTLTAGDLLKVRVDHDWETTYGWSHLNPKTAAFKAGEGTTNDIEVVTGGTYDVVLLVADSRLIIKEHGTIDPDPTPIDNRVINLALGGWDAGDAVFAAWVYGGSYGDGEWVEITDKTKLTIKEDATGLVLMRKSSTMENGWTEGTNYWNRSRGLEIPADKDTLTFTGNWDGDMEDYGQHKKVSEFEWSKAA